jgi:hypothetical protein
VDFRDELKSTSDDFLHKLGRLAELEIQKRQVAPGSPEFVELAAAVEELSRAVLQESRQQMALAEEAERLDRETDDPIGDTPIERIEPSRTVHQALVAWRDAERRLAAAQRGSPEWFAIRFETIRLRDEYARALDAAMAERRD